MKKKFSGSVDKLDLEGDGGGEGVWVEKEKRNIRNLPRPHCHSIKQPVWQVCWGAGRGGAGQDCGMVL